MIGRNRFFLVPISIVSVVVGTVAFESLIHSGSVQQLRQLRNVSVSISADHMDRVQAARQAISQLIEACEAGAIDAAIELDVVYADAFTPHTDREAWQRALIELAFHARAALLCQPTNGLIWARLAFAEWFLGRSGDHQARMMEFSELYAPAEIAAVNARLRHWSRLSSYVLALTKTSFERDLLTFLLWLPPNAAAQAWETFESPQKDAASRLARVVPEERRGELAANGVIFAGSSVNPADELRPSRN